MITFTIIHAGNDSAETITAQGEMLKVAIENLEKIKMRRACKVCGDVKPLMSRLEKCNECFLKDNGLQPAEPVKCEIIGMIAPKSKNKIPVIGFVQSTEPQPPKAA